MGIPNFPKGESPIEVGQLEPLPFGTETPDMDGSKPWAKLYILKFIIFI